MIDFNKLILEHAEDLNKYTAYTTYTDTSSAGIRSLVNLLFARETDRVISEKCLVLNNIEREIIYFVISDGNTIVVDDSFTYYIGVFDIDNDEKVKMKGIVSTVMSGAHLTSIRQKSSAAKISITIKIRLPENVMIKIVLVKVIPNTLENNSRVSNMIVNALMNKED